MKRLLPVLFLISISLSAQTDIDKIKSYISNKKYDWLKEYMQFIAIPNINPDSIGLHQNAYFIQNLLKARGVNTELLKPDMKGVAPVVYGEVITPGATRTIAFYAHYDGQPVNPAQWLPGLAPFKPQLATDRLDRGGKFISLPENIQELNDDWRLYGRSSADDKAGVYAIIAGYEALKESGFTAGINIKFFFEGQEEIGSTNLPDIMIKYKEKLDADLWLIADGPRHQSGRKQLVFGVRGDVNLGINVFGAKRPLHSGNYGNWAPNPAMRLAQLLASMKDKNGNITIKDFYKDVVPLTAAELKALNEVPDVEELLKKELGINKPDGGGKKYLQLLSLPTLNINGIQSANVGAQAANIIPTVATAVIDLRLVKGNDVDRQIKKVVDHIKLQGYYVTEKEPTEEDRANHPLIAQVRKIGNGYNAQRTPMNLPIAQDVIKAIQKTTHDKMVLLPSLGGSLPLYMFETILKAQPITLTMVNYDNNQHAENENLHLRFLWEAIESVAAVMKF